MSAPNDRQASAGGQSNPAEESPFVADAGPLIAMARVDQLHLLRRLFGRGMIPPAVHREIELGSGRPGAVAIAQALEAGWIRVVPLADEEQAASLARIVDSGEAEAIALGLQQDARFLLIDDAKGRKAARRAGLPLVGVAGVLLAAKAQGHLATVSPIMEELASVGYRLSPRLMDGVRHSAGE